VFKAILRIKRLNFPEFCNGDATSLQQGGVSVLKYHSEGGLWVVTPCRWLVNTGISEEHAVFIFMVEGMKY
jgi:hypothetical protein